MRTLPAIYASSCHKAIPACLLAGHDLKTNIHARLQPTDFYISADTTLSGAQYNNVGAQYNLHGIPMRAKKSWREKLAFGHNLPVVKPIPPRMIKRHGDGTIATGDFIQFRLRFGGSI